MNLHGLFAIIFVFTLFSSCGKKSHVGYKIFRYNDASGITSLDPAFASNLSNIWAVQQLFNGLVQLDSNLTVQPCLARRWQVSDNGLIYTFYLRNDVVFHPCPCFASKRFFKADDVIFSFQRLTKTGNGSWIISYLVQDSLGLPIIKAINDTIVQFHLKQPFVQFIQVLATPYAMIVPKEAVEYYDQDFGFHPIGTGPFLFKKWLLNEKLVLNKNPEYFEWEGDQQLPYLDGVSVTFLKDPHVAMLDFIRGKIDFLSGMESVYHQELLDATGEVKDKYKHVIQLLKTSYLNTEYIGFYLGDSIAITQGIGFAAIRKALNLVLNKHVITQYVRKGVGIPADGSFIPPSLRPFTYKEKQHNLDSLQYWINKAGYQSPRDVPAFTLFADPLYAEIYTQVIHQWRELGFRVKLEILDRPTLKSQVTKGQLACFRGSWIGDFADPINYYSVFYTGNWSPVGPNYTHFSSASFDQLYESAMNTANDTLRNVLYQQMDSIIQEQLPVIPLYYDEVVRLVRKDVIGLGINGMNNLDLKRVRKIK